MADGMEEVQQKLENENFTLNFKKSRLGDENETGARFKRVFNSIKISTIEHDESSSCKCEW